MWPFEYKYNTFSFYSTFYFWSLLTLLLSLLLLFSNLPIFTFIACATFQLIYLPSRLFSITYEYPIILCNLLDFSFAYYFYLFYFSSVSRFEFFKVSQIKARDYNRGVYICVTSTINPRISKRRRDSNFSLDSIVKKNSSNITV